MSNVIAEKRAKVGHLALNRTHALNREFIRKSMRSLRNSIGTAVFTRSSSHPG